MLTDDERKTVAGMTRVMQIIVLAMVAGVGAYLAFAVATRSGDEERAMAPIAAGMAAAAFAMAMIVPAMMSGQQRKAIAEGRAPLSAAGASDGAQLLGGLQMRKIIGMALLEGAAFFNVFVYQTGGPAYSVGIAVALLLTMIAHFPLRGAVETWLESELRTVRELRALER